jgi:hypothetical protein
MFVVSAAHLSTLAHSSSERPAINPARTQNTVKIKQKREFNNHHSYCSQSRPRVRALGLPTALELPYAALWNSSDKRTVEKKKLSPHNPPPPPASSSSSKCEWLKFRLSQFSLRPFVL